MPLTRAVYRSLLRVARGLESEATRHGATYLFNEREATQLRAWCSELTGVLRNAVDAPPALRSLVTYAFRHRTGGTLRVTPLRRTSQTETAELDAAVDALAMLSARLGLLRTLAAEPHSSATTAGVRVSVTSQLVPSDMTSLDRFSFSYRVEIENSASAATPVQLVSREWHIRDFNGRVQTVQGPGVVGQQPLLHPGQSYEYTSGAAIATLKGSMQGTYTMLRLPAAGDAAAVAAAGAGAGALFEVEIAPFALCPPRSASGGSSAGSSKGGDGGKGGDGRAGTASGGAGKQGGGTMQRSGLPPVLASA